MALCQHDRLLCEIPDCRPHQHHASDGSRCCDESCETMAALRARITELEDALRPFAEIGYPLLSDEPDTQNIVCANSVRELRRATLVLLVPPPELVEEQMDRILY